MTDNRRERGRAPLQLRVEYPRNSDYESDWTGNVSTRGFFVVTDKTFSIGQEVHARLTLPGQTDPLDMSTRVVWCRQDGRDGPPGVGVKVVGDRDQNALLRLAYRALKRAHGGTFHLVACDDDVDVLHIYTQAVQSLGDKQGAMEISLAQDGKQALEIIGPHGADIVIADLKMPGMDGYELIRRLRHDPRTQEVPIIAVTAQDWKVAAPAARDAGADEVLQKPFRLGEFLELVALLLASRVDVALHD